MTLHYDDNHSFKYNWKYNYNRPHLLHYTNSSPLRHATLHQLLLLLHYTNSSTLRYTTPTTATTTVRYTRIQFRTQHYSTLHYTTLHYIHYTTPQLQLQLQLRHTNYITPTTTPLHYNYNDTRTTAHYIQQWWVRWPLQALQPLQETQLEPPFGPSVDSLCRPCITTTHLSYSVLSLNTLPPPPCAALLVPLCTMWFDQFMFR